MPAELAQRLGAHQPATALQGVEHAADRTQPLRIVRRTAPGGKQFVQVVDLFLEFFQEDLADFVVDLVAGGIEPDADHRRTGLRGHHGKFCNGSLARMPRRQPRPRLRWRRLRRATSRFRRVALPARRPATASKPGLPGCRGSCRAGPVAGQAAHAGTRGSTPCPASASARVSRSRPPGTCCLPISSAWV